jgi:hypothetical protein
VFAGYGNLAPKTPEGKVVTMLYALVGVPLMLLCLSNLGTVLAGTFQFAYSHACCYACAKNQYQHPHQRQKLPEVDHNLHYQPQCKSVNQGPQFLNTYEKAKAVSELPKKVAPPVVPTVHISAVGRGPRIQSRPRAPRPLTPEVRKILTECAEYSLAQASDPAAAKLLQELQQQDPEVGNVSSTDDDAEKEEEDDEEEDDEEEDVEDAEQERRWYNKLSFITNTVVGWGRVVGSCEHSNEPFGFQKRQGIS